MSIEVTPETELLVRNEILSGHFASADELILESLRAWREKKQRENSSPLAPAARQLAADRIRALRKCIALEREEPSLRDFAHLGHRF